MFWQKAGNYLAAHTERFNNARKTREKEVKLTVNFNFQENFYSELRLILVKIKLLIDKAFLGLYLLNKNENLGEG